MIRFQKKAEPDAPADKAEHKHIEQAGKAAKDGNRKARSEKSARRAKPTDGLEEDRLV